MARSFASASSQYLYAASAPVSGLPVTLACWGMRTTNPVATQPLLGLYDASDSNMSLEMRINGSSPHVLQAVARAGGSTATAESTTGTTLNVWTHFASVYASTTSRTAYMDGGNYGSNATSIATSSLDATNIGSLYRGAVAAFYGDLNIAHAAIWSVALSASEIAKLYNSGIGADPRSVRPDALVAYWPLLNDDGDQDYWGNFHLTASGSPTYAQHPPVLMRSRPKYVLLGGAATAPTISSVTLSGTSQIGFTLTASVVTDQDPVESTAYRWQTASDGSGTGAADISGETSSTLALTYADFGSLLDTAAYVRCGAIATKNALPSDEAFSAWQQVTAPSSAGLVSSPLKSPFLIA